MSIFQIISFYHSWVHFHASFHQICYRIDENESKKVNFDLEKLGHLGAVRSRLMIGWGGAKGSISVQNAGHRTTNILFYINKQESLPKDYLLL